MILVQLTRALTRVTARVSDPDPDVATAARYHVRAWCTLHLGQPLEVTNVKDFGMVELWDDRAVTVEKNTGRAVMLPGAATP